MGIAAVFFGFAAICLVQDFATEVAPLLGKRAGRSESMTKEMRFAFIKPTAEIWASPRPFARFGQAGPEISGLLPHTAQCADGICMVRSMVTDHWDDHNNLNRNLSKNCRIKDRPVAALLRDLKQRGLLDSTLVIWGGEFGRAVGETDDLCLNPVTDRVHLHDLHATILRQLGLDHEKLAYRYQGRDFRLTDVTGKIVPQIIV